MGLRRGGFIGVGGVGLVLGMRLWVRACVRVIYLLEGWLVETGELGIEGAG